MAISLNSVVGFNSTCLSPHQCRATLLRSSQSMSRSAFLIATQLFSSPLNQCRAALIHLPKAQPRVSSISLNHSVLLFSLKLQAKYPNVSRYCVGTSVPKVTQFASFPGKLGSRSLVKDERWSFSLSVADSDSATTKTSDEGFANAENEQSQAGANKESGSQASEASNGSTFSSDLKQETSSSPNLQSTPKRSPLTAKERLRAARVLNRYMESKATKSEMGSKVLDALRASDGGKKRSGLPEAPTNLFDDSKRGMPKQGLTFEFPGGFDLFIIAFSFVFISTVMFATTYIVWKVGAIHFNEY
ncbi:uncharacterized protein LOC121267502 isoform X3 [Juglans microcarpa x Juglans regia]|uniref:uncharacterized protein LOC121267502 isoform X3 n=1 Tax=Juglans microcarpa x Juglans regia TaxID=2249226 RepID=UPI001B7E07FA|nr:uncharacterized protein LOC121267502 isoform X3 [Juglans microcarpa x Juglans regia]